MVIKPSGVSYEELTPDSMVVLDIAAGRVVEGTLNPSSDTKTHLELYRAFPEIKGITHTHSINAVAFAQAGTDVKALGTTHADYFYGDIPCTKELSEEDVNTDYEVNTGKVIIETLKARHIDPLATPGILVKNHGPFTWGRSAEESVYHAKVLETVCEMNIKTLLLNPGASMSQYILDKHYNRKHGKDAYYGQRTNGGPSI